MKTLSRFLLAFLLLSILALTGATSPQQPKAELPLLITSCGQSPGPNMITFVLKRLKVPFDKNMQATAQDLIERKKANKPYKTLIIVTGASLKGMGAAGISIEDELKRTAELIAEAKKQNILIIGAHVEGMKRRAQSAAPGDNTDELSIDAVCPNADLLLIKKEGDADGRFTTISKKKNIPMIVFEKNLEMMTVLKKLLAR